MYALLVCKSFGPKIWSCKFFNKFQVWEYIWIPKECTDVMYGRRLTNKTFPTEKGKVPVKSKQQKSGENKREMLPSAFSICSSLEKQIASGESALALILRRIFHFISFYSFQQI